MQQYVAFLRGINVGGHRVAMTRLCQIVASLGFTETQSFIASGNLLFASARGDVAAMEEELGQAFARELGYAAATFIRTRAEVAAIARVRPFDDATMDDPTHTVHVGLLYGALDEGRLAALTALSTPIDSFASVGREFYWLVRGRSTDSMVKMPALARALGGQTTMRNMKMMRRLAVTHGA